MKDQLFYVSVPIQNQIKIENLQRKNKDLDAQSKNLTQKNIDLASLCDENKKSAMIKKEAISQR